MLNNGEIKMDFGGLVEQGNHIVSAYPIRSAQSIFYYNKYAHWFDTSNFRENDWARNMSVCVAEVNGKLLKVINVHGLVNKTRLGDERTLKQSEAILNEALKEDMAVIILGDFNLKAESESIKMIDKHFRNLSKEAQIMTTRSVSSGKGDLVVDYIFVNEKVKVNGFTAVKNEISDHLPLIMDFELV